MHFSLIAPHEGQERRAARFLADHGGSAHRWLWSLFPAPAGSPREFLFREREVGGLPRYYVVSARPPQIDDPAWQVQTRPYDVRPPAGAVLHFDLRANPTVRVTPHPVRETDPTSSSRHDVVMHEKKRLLRERGLARWADWSDGERPAMPELVRRTCGAWLAERGQKRGFVVDADALTAEAYQPQHERDGLRFTSVDLSGTLTVQDEELFAQTLVRGIGSAKAFGCGLLLVRPA